MIFKLNQELEEALIRNHGEPLEVEGQRGETIYVVASRDHFRLSRRAEVDKSKLREAILARRDESRELNEVWQDIDREVCEGSPGQQ